MNKDLVDRLENSFDIRRGGLLKDMEASAGIRHGTREAITQTYGKDMEKGSVVFEPNKEGGGTLRFLIKNEEGQIIEETREITDSNEASLLAGLQAKADRKRGK